MKMWLYYQTKTTISAESQNEIYVVGGVIKSHQAKSILDCFYIFRDMYLC